MRIPPDAAFPSSVADHIARLNVLLKRRLGTFARENFDLSVVETRLLILLGMFAPATVNDLAGRSDIDRTQISRALGILAGRGLVSKASKGTDRREVRATITRQGARVHARIVTFLYSHNAQLIAGLPPQALDGFFSVIQTMIARAQQHPVGASPVNSSNSRCSSP